MWRECQAWPQPRSLSLEATPQSVTLPSAKPWTGPSSSGVEMVLPERDVPWGPPVGPLRGSAWTSNVQAPPVFSWGVPPANGGQSSLTHLCSPSNTSKAFWGLGWPPLLPSEKPQPHCGDLGSDVRRGQQDEQATVPCLSFPFIPRRCFGEPNHWGRFPSLPVTFCPGEASFRLPGKPWASSPPSLGAEAW